MWDTGCAKEGVISREGPSRNNNERDAKQNFSLLNVSVCLPLISTIYECWGKLWYNNFPVKTRLEKTSHHKCSHPTPHRTKTLLPTQMFPSYPPPNKNASFNTCRLLNFIYRLCLGRSCFPPSSLMIKQPRRYIYILLATVFGRAARLFL